MKLEITIDESILKELVLPSVGNMERTNMITRVNRHILVGSHDLIQQWLLLLENDDLFRKQPLLREAFENWLTDIVTDKTRYKAVKVSGSSKAQGNPVGHQVAQLEAAYESESKIVVGDYSYDLRRANPELRFVSKSAFSKTNPTSITIRQVQDVLEGPNNLKNDLFVVFETPIQLVVNQKSSATLLAKYLAHFYDDKLIIQDAWFLADEQNRKNFEIYILPFVNKDCKIEIRAIVNHKLAKIGTEQKRHYERKEGYNIQLHCIDGGTENLHRGYIESTKYRINIPYRLFVFGTKGENSPDTISIFKK